MAIMNIRLFLLILSDVLILSSFGLIGPILAVFITESVEGGTLVAVGFATTIFLVVKSVIQIPLSKYFIDKEKHKTKALLAGTFLIITVPFIYFFADSIKTIYLAQAVHGLGAALAYPAWFSLFTTYMDKKHKGFEYTLWSTSIGAGTALAAYVGATLADNLGFRSVFFIVGAISLLGFIDLIVLDRIDGQKKPHKKPKQKILPVPLSKTLKK